MSLTIQEMLDLPALKQAKVIAGKSSLNKVVGSVSVLEYSQPTIIQNEILKHINFNNDEIVLTAFASIRNDVAAQCRNVETLAAAGEVGIIIFYVGLIVPKIDPRLIATANRLNFLLICMPKNDPNLTYSTVITEIMFAVFNDQIENPNFATPLIKKVSGLPTYQQNMDTVLRLISDRLHVSLALVDDTKAIIATQFWPQTNELDWSGLLKNSLTEEQVSKSHLHQQRINDSNYYLFIYQEAGNLSHVSQQQALETVQIAMNLWHDQPLESTNLADLVEAIIQNEPQKINDLAKYYRIRLSDLTSLLIINDVGDVTSLSQLRKDMEQIALAYSQRVIAEYYDQALLIFPLKRLTNFQDWQNWQQAIQTYNRQQGLKLTTTRFVSLNNPTAICNAYIQNHRRLSAAQIIFPRRTSFSEQDLVFTQSCQQLISQDASRLKRRLTSFTGISPDLIKTLLVFCLDAQANIEETASKLYIHRNTVKYRINKLNDILGFRLGTMPESFSIYQLAAAYRLINGDPE
jgi:DNA-binding PucR family transcriptional regulator